jgi:lipopolysaccharide export system protein LptA
VWTPKRVLLLASGFVVFCAVYVGYAQVLGGIDGLPALPPKYWRVDPSPGDPPPQAPLRQVEVKLQQAFGDFCPELFMPIQVESPRGVVIASRDCFFERGGREVQLKPVSMAFFRKVDGKEAPEIKTVHGAAAILVLDQPITSPLELSKRRIVSADLLGEPRQAADGKDEDIVLTHNRCTLRRGDDIEIRIPRGPVHFDDELHLIHTNDLVTMTDHQTKPETKVTARGLEVHLAPNAPAAGKPGPGKGRPEGSGSVEQIALLSDVEMHIYQEGGSGFPALGATPAKAGARPAAGEPPDHVHITTAGRFVYDLARSNAQFHIPEKASQLAPEWVTVTRHPRNDDDEKKQDTLRSEHLELQLRRKAADAPPKPGAPAAGDGPGLDIEWIHAWGNKVIITSAEQHITGEGNDLVHQALTHTTVLKGVPQAWLAQGFDEIHAPELEMVEQKEQHTQRVTARGQGSIHLWDKNKQKRTLHARWAERFVSLRDGSQDVLTFKGNAALVEDEHIVPQDIFVDSQLQACRTFLRADDLQIWLDPPPATAAPPPAAAPPSAPRPGDAAAAQAGGRKPRRVEALGHVVARAPEFRVLERDPPTQRLTIHFKDVPPAAPAAVIPAGPAAPAAADSVVVPPTPTQPPAPVKPEPQPADKPARPVELAAVFITAHVLRYDGPGNKTEIDRLETEGKVHVIQAPSGDDKGFDIRGEKLALTRRATGNHLRVTGDPGGLADLQTDRLLISGPEVEIDQGDNTATVDGDGYMRMENTTDFQGNPLRKPEWLTVHWKKLMRFEGNFAEFHGDIEAEQASSRLHCQMLQVYFDKPVSLSDQRNGPRKDRPKGQEPARAQKMVCDRGVKVDEEAYETWFRLSDESFTALRAAAVPDAVLARLYALKGRDFDSRERFSEALAALLARADVQRYQDQVTAHAAYEPQPRRLAGFKSLDCVELVVQNLERSMIAEGPGVVRIVQRGSGIGDASAGPEPRAPAKPADSDWTLTLVTYGRFGDALGSNRDSAGRMNADNVTHTALFLKDIQVLHLPWSADPKRLRAPVNMAAALANLPPGGLYMECRDKLKIYSPEDESGAMPRRDGDTGKHIMTGIGQVYVRATDASGKVFWGNAQEIHYDEAKEQVIFDGKDGLAQLFRVERPGAKPADFTGKKIIYWRRNGQVEVDGAVKISGEAR